MKFNKPIMWNGKNLNRVQAYASKWQTFVWKTKRFLRKLAIVSLCSAFAFGLLYGAFSAGKRLFPRTVYAVQEIKVKDTTPSPILVAIAKCESGGKHTDKNGQVLINASMDIGKYQINVPLWGKTASAMGLNLANEQDNEKFAMWLFENHGSEEWRASIKCWNK